MPTPNAPPEAPDAGLVERLRADVARLIEISGSPRFGVAVSGGPDSMAMLLLAQAAFPGRIEAATVDHGLRPASGAEAAHVATLCGRLCVAHATLAVKVARRGNLSANARVVRYDALEAWRTARGLDWLMTAHHADDQLETIVMRLNRASGVGGLAGIRRRQGHVLRPLLRWRRAELVAVVTAANIDTVDDPTNRDDQFDRARLRKLLADVDWLDPVAVAVSAENLGDADDALSDAVDLALAERLFPQMDGGWTFDAEHLPHELTRRAFIACLRAVESDAAPRAHMVEAAFTALSRGKAIVVGKTIVRAKGTEWTFRPAPPRRGTV